MTSILVSHRSVDTDAAERIASELQAAGHEVWLDLWELRLGDSIVGRMNAGLDVATHLVLCCSTAGVDAPWIGREWMSALARQLNGASIRVLPVLLPGSRPPAILADLKYADFGTNYDAALGELLRELAHSARLAAPP